MIPPDVALLDKTEIVAKTKFMEATLVVAKAPYEEDDGTTCDGYSCALWGGRTGAEPQFLASHKFRSSIGAIAKAAVLAPLLVQAKDYVGATAAKYPEGLQVSIRVEHGGKVHSVDGKLPLDKNQLVQFASLLDWVRQVNSVVNQGR